MTRETKVGLLVGIGVVLLIGIIISDQLAVIQKDGPSKTLARFGAVAQKSIFPSKFNNQSSSGANNAHNTTHNREYESNLTNARQGNGFSQSSRRSRHNSKIQTPQELKNNRQGALPPRAFALNKSSNQTNDSHNANGRATKSSYHPVHLSLAGKPPKNSNNRFNKKIVSSQAQTNSATAQSVVHTVQSGETLYAIAAQYYHKGSKWRVIAKANPKKIGDDGQIKVGEKLVIPDKDGSLKTSAEARQKTNNAKNSLASNSKSNLRKIEVKNGDTLAGLAHRYLGSSSKWRKILKANSKKLDGPRDIRPGMTLLIPD